MARVIDFESEFRKTSSTFLSPEQRHLFFKKLKHVVVIVNTEPKRPGTSRPTSALNCSGAGVIVDENGTMLTSAYLVPDNVQSILVRREVDRDFWEARIVTKSPQHDLAIIVPKKVGKYDFATFDTEGSFGIGKEVLSILHVGNLSYTSVIGQLACQDHRLFGDMRSSLKLNHDLKLLQINNFHGSPSAPGAPVFNSSGQVIGLSSFVLNKFDFAVHLTVLKQFYESYQESKRNETGKSYKKRKALSIA